MKDKDLYAELSSIRNLMERSTKFISLSGLSGVLAGTYAIVGAVLAYKLVYKENSGLRIRDMYVNDPLAWWPLMLIALGVLVLSLVTGFWLTIRKANRKKEQIWNAASRGLLTSMAVPLISGGLLMLILVYRGDYGIIAPASLIFYGLSLVAGSNYTVADVKYLGFCQIFLGLLAALLPGYGIVCWVAGFGVLHIIYGAVMHFKYDG